MRGVLCRLSYCESMEARPGFEPGMVASCSRVHSSALPTGCGAAGGIRTRDVHVGNVVLCRLSYSRMVRVKGLEPLAGTV